jgi:cobalt-zinc-cadmium efflux system protein
LGALLLTAGFMFAEIIGGLLSGSLALLADAAHMLTDTVALALAWFAFWLSERPADRVRTYGYHRFPVLVAFANGVGLVVIVAWLFIEAIGRLFNPGEVLGGLMLIAAVLGLAANAAAFAILHGAERDNLNIRSALLHIMGDLLGSLAAVVAAVVILLTGWTPIDPLLSVAVGLLVLRSAWLLLKEAGHILLEGAPWRLDVREVGADLVEHIPGLTEVHHVHAWSLSQEKLMLTLHARLEQNTDSDAATAQIQRRLAERFGIAHATVQIERETCADHLRGTL